MAVVAGLLLAGTGAALDASEPVRVRIGVEVNSPPLSYQETEGNLTGFAVELLREADLDPEIEFELVPGFWRHLAEQFAAGRLDALANVIITDERRATMDFSISHAVLHGTSYTRRDRPPVTRARDLAGRRIGMLSGSIALSQAESQRSWGGTIVTYDGYANLLAAVRDGSCDAAVVLRPLSFEQPDDADLRRELVDDISYRFHVAVQRGDRARLERINEALASVRQSPAFDRLYGRWIGPIEPRPIRLADLRPYALPALAAALVLGVIFAWQRRVNRALAAHAAAVDASEEKYRLVVQNAHEGILLIQDGVFRFANAAAQRLLGRPESGLVGLPYLDFVAPELRSEIRHREEQLFRGEVTRTHHEHLIARPDGTQLWIETVSIKVDWHGRPAVLVFAADITQARRAETERREAERQLRESLHEKEALLKEVHHRVKNNLQVVSSLLRLESSRQLDRGTRNVLQEMTGRIRSMAMLHETIYRSGSFGRIDLADYLGRLATYALRSADPSPGRVRLQTNLAPVALEIDRAIPCGLIVNELVANALKHAFPDHRAGTVSVTLTPPDAQGTLHLEVSDDGVGLPEDLEGRRNQSLGLRLVSDLARQLGGELRILPGPRFQVTFNPDRVSLPAETHL